MVELSRNSNAFIRPSPTSGTLGGVKKSTRESILICEAGGYDVILVETVGIGQSEISISEMVDFCLLLLISGAGDELQGIKKGVLELADIIAINKADGDSLEASKRTALEYKKLEPEQKKINDKTNPPALIVEFFKAQKNINNFSCYSNDGGNWKKTKLNQRVSQN